MLYSHTEIKTNILNIKKMAKATKQELETAKAKAVKGGMPQEVADKVIQMASSKGTFAMQMNKPKNYSTDNFSSKDALTMMQSALYNPGHGGEPGHTHGSNKIPTVTVEKSSSSTNVDGGGSNNSSSSGTGVSYSEAYKKADKNKYPTLESFTEAAKSYNKKQNSNKSNNISNQSSSSSKNISLSDKSESDILGDQKSITNTNKSIIEGIDDLAKINRTKDSIDVRNAYTNTFNFPKFKKANTPGTPEYDDANQVASAYAASRQSNSGYTDFPDAISRSVDSQGRNLFPTSKDFVNAIKRGRYEMEGGRLPSRVTGTSSSVKNSSGAETASRFAGKSWDVQKTMEDLRKEQSNLPLNMAPLKFYGGKNKR